MNLKELNENVKKLTDSVINKHHLDYEKVRIQYVKYESVHMLCAMNGDELIAHLEWR